MLMTGTFATLSALLGQATRDEEEFVYEFAAAPEGWWRVGGLLLIGALLWVVVWMYRHEGRAGSTRKMRTGLAVVRCAIILTLAAIWMEPVKVRYLRRLIDSYTVLLVDNSSSMDLADTYRDEADAARVRAVMETDELEAVNRRAITSRILDRGEQRFIRELAERNRVKIYTFSDEPSPVATVRAAREEPEGSSSAADGAEAEGQLVQADQVRIALDARGSATNVERAVRRSVESLGSAPIAGVVLITDGGINQGRRAEGIAQYARDRKLPLHVVGVGDPSPPRNVRVGEVLAPEYAVNRDPFAVTARLATQGIEERTVSVQLTERDPLSGDRGGVAHSG